MNKNSVRPVFIYLTAYSPDKNIIASVRADKIGKYMTQFADTYVVAGIDQYLARERKAERPYSLINIPTRNKKLTPLAKKSSYNSGVKCKVMRWLKAETLPVLELVLPVSPGGFLVHNVEKYFEVLASLCREHQGRDIVVMASYGPLFIWRLARRIKYKYPEVRVLADFRDWAWLYAEGWLYRTWIWKIMTAKMISACDAVTFVAEGIRRCYEREFRIPLHKSHFLPNGYDPEDMYSMERQLDTQVEAESFDVVYTGSFHNETRDPRTLLTALSLCRQRGMTIKFNYAGKDSDYLQQLGLKLDPELEIADHGFLPRSKSLLLQNGADLLVLIAYTGHRDGFGDSILTGKVYEYLSSGRPMLVIGPAGWELRKLVESDGVSAVIDSKNIDQMVDFIQRLCVMRKMQRLPNRQREKLHEYSYPNIAGRLNSLMCSTLRRL